MISINKQRSLSSSVSADNGFDVCRPICDQCLARHASMCSALKNHEVQKLFEITTNIEKKPKQIICAEGDPADHLFNIRSGCVRVSKMLADGRRQIIGFLFSGDIFGLACANGYSYSVESITPVELCRMPRTQIFEKFSEFPALGGKVLDITRTELQSTQDQMLLLGRKTAKEKLCTFLLAMKDKITPAVNIPDNMVLLPMSRSDIADYLGLTIETVSRQFTILSKEKLILLQDNAKVQLLEPERLKLIASGE